MPHVYTPDPWEAVDVSTGSATRKVQFKGSDGRAALIVEHDGSAEGLANERLAQNAPRLLRELTRLVERLEETHGYDQRNDGLATARDTLAEATRQPVPA